jgi:hypothetical protein
MTISESTVVNRMQLDNSQYDVPEPYRGHYRRCLNSTFDQIMNARRTGRHLSLFNAIRVFARHWHQCLSVEPTHRQDRLSRSGCEQAERLLRTWFSLIEKP